MHVLGITYTVMCEKRKVKKNVIATPMGYQYTRLRMTPLKVLAVAMETFDLYFNKLRLQKMVHSVEIFPLECVSGCQNLSNSIKHNFKSHNYKSVLIICNLYLESTLKNFEKIK